MYTVIHENFAIEKFSFHAKWQNFFTRIFLLVGLYTANIWHTFDMNENIVTQKFLAKNIANEINANYITQN